MSEYSDAAIVALQTIPMEEEHQKQYDAVIGLNDDPVHIVRKLRDSLASRQDNPETEDYDLSAREKEILVCVAKGMLNKEIADHCNLSIHTVITHRKNITRKTGIKTVAGLTVYALLNNLIDSNSIDL
jgi:DNA-binding CsgD family transcriptional regulator